MAVATAAVAGLPDIFGAIARGSGGDDGDGRGEARWRCSSPRSTRPREREPTAPTKPPSTHDVFAREAQRVRWPAGAAEAALSPTISLPSLQSKNAASAIP